ncbi:hypothetical protein D3C80_1927770 [compost metagenome]
MPVHSGTAQILHAHIGGAGALHVEKFSRLAGYVDDAAFMERSTVIDANNDRGAVFSIGNAGIAG